MSNEPTPQSDDITLSFSLNSTTHRVLLHLEGDIAKFIEFVQGVTRGIAMAQQQPVTVHSHELTKDEQARQARFEEFLRTIEKAKMQPFEMTEDQKAKMEAFMQMIAKSNTTDEPGIKIHTPTAKPI